MKKDLLLLFSFITLISSPLTFTSCGDDIDTPSFVGNNSNANIPGADNSVTRLEIPRMNPANDYICHRLSDGQVNYTIEYDKTKYHSRWVAYTYDTRNAMKNYPSRTDAWGGDPYYDKNKEYQLGKQYFSGYDRGHLVGSAERYYSEEANAQTFYMTNMSPMQSAFNSEYWGEIEDKARDNWGRGVIDSKSIFYQGTLYITKGGTIDDDKILGYLPLQNTLGKTVNTVIPKYYWLACLFVSKEGTCRSIGFWMEHKDYRLNTNDAVAMQKLRRDAACSIDELEARTGIDFFCNLKDNVEEAVEKTYDISLWPGL